MKTPEGYEGPQLNVMIRNIKQEEVKPFVARVMDKVPQSVQKIALFQQDKIDGDLTQNVIDTIQARDM